MVFFIFVKVIHESIGILKILKKFDKQNHFNFTFVSVSKTMTMWTI